MREIRWSLPELIILSNLIPDYLHNYWTIVGGVDEN